MDGDRINLMQEAQRLIESALALSDQLDLHSVGIALDEARLHVVVEIERATGADRVVTQD